MNKQDVRKSIKTARRPLAGIVNLAQKRIWFADDSGSYAAVEASIRAKAIKVSTGVEPDWSGNASVENIYSPQKEAHTKALELSASKQYTAEYKATEIKRIFAEATERVERLATSEVSEYDEAIKKHTVEARMPLAISAEIAPSYMATKAVVEARVSDMTQSEFVEFWNERLEIAAIHESEKLTIRVLVDFHNKLIGREMKDTSGKGRPIKLGEAFQVSELVRVSQALLMPKEVKRAQDALAQAKANKAAAERARMTALQSLRPGWSIQNGEFIDGSRMDMRRMLRG